MPKGWQEGFDFYFTELGEHPASVFLDLAAQPHVPVATHPTLVIVFMHMKAPRPNGLRSEEEAQTLFQLEDRMISALVPLDALFVGRIVTNGRSDLFLYAPPGTTADTVEARLRDVVGDYRIRVHADRDAEWETYQEGLYPTPTDRQLMANGRVVEQLRENGDDLSAHREVDHFAYLPDERTAAAAAQRLTARGFRADAPRPPEPGGAHQMWSLPFHRRDPVTLERANEVTLEILEVLEGTGAHYDGWGCVVVSKRN